MANGEEKRILVVDDDDAIRTLLFTILRRRGLKVDTARNGAGALEKCARCRYAVMLLDLNMPLVSGYEVLDRIEAMPPEHRPLTIVLTAGLPPRNLSSELVAGTVRKPFDIELLIDSVAACLSTMTGREQLRECPEADSNTLPEPRRNDPN